MASLQTVVELVFNGIDNASDVTKKISDSLGDLSGAAKDISQPFSELAGDLALVQVALTGVLGVVGTLAYKESVDFETSLISLQKQMDETEGSARDFGAVLETLGVKYGINANTLVESAADFKAAGYDIGTSTELVEQSLKLVIAGGVDAASAVDIMNRSLAGFDIPAKDVIQEANHIGDVLNKTADLTKSSFTELSQGFSDLSPIARLTGLSFEETAAVLSKVIDTFGSGSEAANGLKSGFLSLVDPTKEAREALKQLGVEFDAAGRPIGSIKDILSVVNPKFLEMEQNQRLAAASIIFGKDQAGKMVVALNSFSDAMELADKITKEATGSIQKEVDLRLKSAQAVINSTNESWRQLLKALGNEFQINTTGVISGIGALGLAIKSVVEKGGLDPLFDQLNPQLKNLEELFKAVAKNLPEAFKGIDFSALVKALDSLGLEAKKAIESLFGPIDLSSVDGLKKSIQQVIDVLAGLTNVTAGELGGLSGFLVGINKLATSFKDATPEAQGFIGQILGFSVGLNQASGALDGINTALLGFVAFGGKLSALGSEAGLLAAGLAGPQGVAVALGAAATAIVTFLVPAEKLSDYSWPDWLAGYEGATAGTALADIADGFASLGQRLGLFSDQSDRATVKIADVGGKLKDLGQQTDAEQSLNRVADATQKNIDAYEKWLDELAKKPDIQIDGAAEKIKEATNQTIAWGDSIKGLPPLKPPDGVDKIEDIFQAAGKSAGAYTTSIEGVSTVYKQIGEGTVKATGAFAAVADKTEEAKKQLEALTKSGKLSVDQLLELTKTSNDFKVKMEEIASDERIKNIEFAVQLKTAQLEADVKRIQSTFESIDTTIGSTGDLLGSLFSDFAGTSNVYDKLDITSQIDLENKRRQDALDIQRKLAEAEIERVEAQTRALNRGDALIRIDGTGLAPELEAFMWKIVEAVRVRANAEFADYLLASGAS